MEATPNTRAVAESNDRQARTFADKRLSVAGPGNARADGAKDEHAQEDWLSLATADPASWLKEVDG